MATGREIVIILLINVFQPKHCSGHESRIPETTLHRVKRQDPYNFPRHRSFTKEFYHLDRLIGEEDQYPEKEITGEEAAKWVKFKSDRITIGYMTYARIRCEATYELIDFMSSFRGILIKHRTGQHRHLEDLVGVMKGNSKIVWDTGFSIPWQRKIENTSTVTSERKGALRRGSDTLNVILSGKRCAQESGLYQCFLYATPMDPKKFGGLYRFEVLYNLPAGECKPRPLPKEEIERLKRNQTMESIKEIHIGILIGAPIGTVFLILILITGCCICYMKLNLRREKFEPTKNLISYHRLVPPKERIKKGKDDPTTIQKTSKIIGSILNKEKLGGSQMKTDLSRASVTGKLSRVSGSNMKFGLPKDFVTRKQSRLSGSTLHGNPYVPANYVTGNLSRVGESGGQSVTGNLSRVGESGGQSVTGNLSRVGESGGQSVTGNLSRVGESGGQSVTGNLSRVGEFGGQSVTENLSRVSGFNGQGDLPEDSVTGKLSGVTGSSFQSYETPQF